MGNTNNTSTDLYLEAEADYQLMSQDGTERLSKAVPPGSYLLRPPCEFSLHNYAELKRDEREWLSKPFYTGLMGYKMCLGVFPGGNGEGKGSSVSVCVHLMRGDCDSELKWPFRGSVVVELINQLADHTHYRRSIIFNDHTPNEHCVRLTPGTERTEVGFGLQHYISRSELGHKSYTWWLREYECQYLKDNTLKFRILKVANTPFYSLLDKFV